MFLRQGGLCDQESALLATIHEQVDRGQVRREISVLLPINGMLIILPFDFHAAGSERFDIEIIAGGAAGKITLRAEMLAEVEQPLRAVTLGRQVRGPNDRTIDGEPAAHAVNQLQIKND